ncbi:Ribosome biogenesis protein Sqt1 [Taphrina deformans PYCC 5710]|uniref:Ribosome biogenesis protein Sqt1 n=1 Tax=Taphrina deformans (strain PYCC 5710 / ATCC 11124 / CBS 356.35 / IMI 108563 / JCM 9778 / NBRC 8474) TaxID=1097556 RepID=R4XB78_TAPDE|nr:Ribosome biogenesis protein Sqt1 [Taphrina deformans PYCC 5710]|eukprot:CCG82860.1 Ribosome biogenesis protein Sqt1 [Taphrina deformans PYCC 5710]
MVEPSQPVLKDDDPQHLQDDDVEEMIEKGIEPEDHDMSDSEESDSGHESESETAGVEGQNQETFQDESVQGFFEHTDSIYCIAISPSNSDLCATGGGDDTAYLWSITSGERLSTLSGHSDSITSIEFSFDGQLLATASMDGTIRIWTLQGERVINGDDVKVLEAGSEVLWMQFHPRGHVLIAGTSDSTVWMWHASKGEVMKVFAGHTAASTYGCWARDGKSFASVSEDGTIILWDPVSATPRNRWETSQDDRLSGGDMGWNIIALNSSGMICTVGSAEGKAKVINLANGALLASLETQTDSIEAIVYATTLPLLAIASIDGSIALYEVPSMKLRSILRHDDAVVGLHFEPATPFLFSISTDATVRQWDVRTSTEVQRWHGHQDTILCMAVQRGCKKIVTAGDDKAALVFSQS